ncbi:uncharacterized protein LOC134204812 [Armigeres subalbatus]|uniref:uncharacterized protein LOC134204812 n=1 Tax=Armigeres subalbatus TaxID=124917 RepID=UPI002ED00D35
MEGIWYKRCELREKVFRTSLFLRLFSTCFSSSTRLGPRSLQASAPNRKRPWILKGEPISRAVGSNRKGDFPSRPSKVAKPRPVDRAYEGRRLPTIVQQRPLAPSDKDCPFTARLAILARFLAAQLDWSHCGGYFGPVINSSSGLVDPGRIVDEFEKMVLSDRREPLY